MTQGRGGDRWHHEDGVGTLLWRCRIAGGGGGHLLDVPVRQKLVLQRGLSIFVSCSFFDQSQRRRHRGGVHETILTIDLIFLTLGRI